MPLNQLKAENGNRSDYMINLKKKSYVAKLGFELESPGSVVSFPIDMGLWSN